jgi:hypothetical protein
MQPVGMGVMPPLLLNLPPQGHNSDDDDDAPVIDGSQKPAPQLAQEGALLTIENAPESVQRRFSLITEAELNQIHNPETLRKIIMMQQSLVISETGKNAKRRRKKESNEIRAINALRNASGNVALQTIAQNRQNRAAYDELNRENWIHTAVRVFGFILSALSTAVSIASLVMR